MDLVDVARARRFLLALVAVGLLAAACAEAPAAQAAPTGPPAPTVSPTLPPALAAALRDPAPRAATEPGALAEQIAVAESTVTDPTRPPEQVAAGGRLAQAAYLELARHPERDAAVLSALPPRIADVTRRNVTACRELLALSADQVPGDTLPAWRIVDPLPPEQLRAFYAEGEARFGVPWTVLAAVNLVESRMGRIVGVSGAGAQGPMQFMPATWARYGMGGDIHDPHDAILGAAHYLQANGAASGTDAGLDRALFHYNNDMRYVHGVREYAALMRDDERAYLGFHAWQVYTRIPSGDMLLPTGYDEPRPIRLVDWLARGGSPAPR